MKNLNSSLLFQNGKFCIAKQIIVCLFLSASFFASAQVQIDKSVQLTGSGTDARINGIKSVIDSLDAASAEAVQSGNLIYSAASGSSDNFSLTISPPVSAYSTGMAFNFISNQNVTGPATLAVNNLAAMPIKKNINQDLGQCDVQTGQMVTVVYDGTNFQMTSVSVGQQPTTANAGSNLLNQTALDTTVALAADSPTVGSGYWSIISGSGGSFSNQTSPTSSFTGRSSATYILRWNTYTSCSTSWSDVTVSFTAHGSSAFNETGADQYFTVPTSLTSINVELWGAGGSGGCNSGGDGGGGAYLSGSLQVSGGQVLKVIVGEAGTLSGSTAYGGGGSGSSTTYNGGGGGRSAIQITSGTDVLTAGGGGGGGEGWRAGTYEWYGSGGGGGATTGSNGNTGPDGCSADFGLGGSNTTGGGAGGISCTNSTPWNGLSGSQYTGGNFTQANGGFGGGGGGGYYGGGSGASGTPDGGGGGGGGSSYYPATGFTLSANIAGGTINNGTNAPAAAGGTSSPHYKNSAGTGGFNGNCSGSNGYVYIYW